MTHPSLRGGLPRRSPSLRGGLPRRSNPLTPIFCKITSSRIQVLNIINFFLPTSSFEYFFSFYCFSDRGKFFISNQEYAMILVTKSFVKSCFMFLYSFFKIWCNSCIQCTIFFIRHDIHISFFCHRYYYHKWIATSFIETFIPRNDIFLPKVIVVIPNPWTQTHHHLPVIARRSSPTKQSIPLLNLWIATPTENVGSQWQQTLPVIARRPSPTKQSIHPRHCEEAFPDEAIH